MFFVRLMPAKERVLQLYVFTVFVVLFACPAFAKDKIIWVDVDAPPFYILEGNEKGKGVVDEITLLLQKNMPQYDHEHQVINLSKADVYDAKRGTCVPRCIIQDKRT